MLFARLRSLFTNESIDSVTIFIVAVAIWSRYSHSSLVLPFKNPIISATSDAWSPILLISVIILRAVDTCLKSLATGCCWSKSFRQRDSTFLSRSSSELSRGSTSHLISGFPSFNAFAAKEIHSSHIAPISISFLFKSASCSSNLLLIFKILLS